jgi:type IV pilus biogenesis protein CpaD/CtpE
MTTKNQILEAAKTIEGKRRQRTLAETDAADFLQLTAANPGCRVRVYSAQGFVPLAYKYRAPITYIESQPDGTVTVREADAKRSNGDGSTRVVAKSTLAAASHAAA